MNSISAKKSARRHLPFPKAGSFGDYGTPKPASYGRLKGLYTGGLIDNGDHLSAALSEFESAKMKLNGIFTRVQYRAVIEGEFLRQNPEIFRPILEAAVRLDPGHLGKEPFLIYLSCNSESRQPHPDDIIAGIRNMSLVQRRAGKTINQLLEGILENGFAVEILSGEMKGKKDKIEELHDLYKDFNWSKNDVEQVLSSPDKIIGIVKDNERIVSAGVAEIVLIPLGKVNMRLAEISEAATLESHGNRKLYKGISTLLLLELKRLSLANKIFSGEVDLVFGESNLFSRQILTVAAQQGREFSTDTTSELGFPDAGIIRQQVPIPGSFKCKSKFNDLVVTSIRRSTLYSLK